MFIQCKPYNPGSPVYVNVDKILYLEEAQYGSRIVMADGKSLLVGEWPQDINVKIRNLGENNE